MENLMGSFNPQAAMQVFNTESKYILTVVSVSKEMAKTTSDYYHITAPNSQAAMVEVNQIIKDKPNVVEASLHEILATTSIDVVGVRKAIEEADARAKQERKMKEEHEAKVEASRKAKKVSESS